VSLGAGLELSGAKVTVMGLGLFGGGVASARFAAQRGAQVTVTDLRDAATLAPALEQLVDLDLRLVLGEHNPADFEQADLIIASPAVAPNNRHLESARKAGVPITSEIALFLEEVRAPVIAISGTQGKSSTTFLLSQLLGAEGRRVHLGGNIGRPLLPDLECISPEDICALELSSYQLQVLPDEIGRPRADSALIAGALTNVLSDHLERHGTRENYAAAKLRLAEIMAPGSTLLLPSAPLPVSATPPADVRVIRPNSSELELRDGTFWYEGQALGQVEHSPFPAPFQQQNLLLALALAACAGVDPEALARAIPKLQGMPHRLNRLGDLDGRPLWDNSVSTTPDSTLSAVEALPDDQIVLLGGRVKDLPMESLIQALVKKKSHAVVFGEARAYWPQLFRAAQIPCEETSGALEALSRARELDGAGILLSPAGSSFDAFPNFQARSDALLKLADQLGLIRR
jgi:UDP-N-acetylmuramoylalanine--D-glutamate ligase